MTLQISGPRNHHSGTISGPRNLHYDLENLYDGHGDITDTIVEAIEGENEVDIQNKAFVNPTHVDLFQVKV